MLTVISFKKNKKIIVNMSLGGGKSKKYGDWSECLDKSETGKEKINLFFNNSKKS